MWIFTKYGFFSVVCARVSAGSRLVDTGVMQIRARDKRQLQALHNAYPQLQPFSIYESATADYAYRLFVPKTIWQRVAYNLCDDIDYSDFKSMLRQQSECTEAYYSACGRVWAVMRSLTFPKPRQKNRHNTHSPEYDTGMTENDTPKKVIECDGNVTSQKAKTGYIVEDTTVVGGTDEQTGAPVIRTKTPEGIADATTEATDARENKES